MERPLPRPSVVVTGGVTKNYSRRGAGYLVETTVTIGYDTPWRQVNAMLLEAAARTPGILAQPLAGLSGVAIDIKNVVARRTSYGGTAPDAVKVQLAELKKHLKAV